MMTKTVRRRILVVYLFVTSLLTVASPLTYFGWWKDRMACLHNLHRIDHGLNCGPTVALYELKKGERMNPDDVVGLKQNGAVLCCPSGEAYDISYIVGEHPKCPVHGDLIASTGHVVHGPLWNEKEALMQMAIWMFLLSGFLMPASVCLFAVYRLLVQPNNASSN